MNDDPSNLAAAMVAARFSAEDEARSRWLAEAMKRREYGDHLCSKGHPLVHVGKQWRCRVCNAERMRERRAKGEA